MYNVRKLRKELSTLIKTTQALANERHEKSGAEITIALRHLQDARMRLGVAECLEKDIDPWVNEIPDVE